LKKEKILGALLFLLSLSLIVVPIIAAFSAHGWDPKATLLGDSNPLETQFENLQNLDVSNMFANPTLTSIQGNTITGSVQVTSPLDFPIKIKNVSGNIICKDHGVVLGPARLASEVEFSAHESKNLSIICTLTQDGLTDVGNHLLGGGLPTNIDVENVNLKLDIYGIVIEVVIGSL